LGRRKIEILKILKIFWEEEKLISSKTQKTQNILGRRKLKSSKTQNTQNILGRLKIKILKIFKEF
jgi:hypothetical protein